MLELACADGPVQARVWDFGGQHILYAMHEFFLTARSLYLLIALNYGREPRDTTVLRPDWLANGIYALLNSKLVVA